MAASQPAILPITTSDPAAPAAATASAVRAYLGRLSDAVRPAISLRRPWSELLDRSALSRPDSLSEAAARLRKNLAYFRVNYLIVIAAVLAASLASNPLSLLLLLALLAAWAFLYLFRPADSPPLVLMGRQFSDRETLLALVGLTIFVVFLTSVGSVVVSALALGSAIVAAHGAFRVPEDLFLDDQGSADGSGVGFLYFLTGGSAVSSAAVPAVAAGV